MARIFIPVTTGSPSGTPTSSPNKIITRGMGATRAGVAGRQGLIVQGYGGPPPSFVTETLLRQINLGQSGFKRRMAELDEIIVWAKLIEANGVAPKKPIKGWIRVKVRKESGYSSVMAEAVGTRIRSALDYIKVTVSRLK